MNSIVIDRDSSNKITTTVATTTAVISRATTKPLKITNEVFIMISNHVYRMLSTSLIASTLETFENKKIIM